jgi:hypothetical protein
MTSEPRRTERATTSSMLALILRTRSKGTLLLAIAIGRRVSLSQLFGDVDVQMLMSGCVADSCKAALDSTPTKSFPPPVLVSQTAEFDIFCDA